MIVLRTSRVDGVNLRYLTAGHGPAVLLLHGYTQTSRMWRPIIPLLAARFTVIAPDLPGIGDSAIPADGSDMKTAAIRIHALVKSIGLEKARVVGHDIGLMVAYAYAAQFPAETEKLVVMDAFLPGVPGWEDVYNNPGIWHFRFNGPTPEALVRGRERTYFDYFWNDFAADKTHSIPEADRAAFLNPACGADADLLQEVESLLASSEHTLGFLQTPVQDAAQQVAAQSSAAQRVGPYELIRLIGSGGMGDVYLAERADEQFRRKVAIKLMRAGLEQSHILLPRFSAEREILASLDHPNIAHLLDGGVVPRSF